MISHYNWLSDDSIILWGDLQKPGYYIINFQNSNFLNFSCRYISAGPDGHPSAISDGLILTDTYPGKDRHSTLLSLHIREDIVHEHKILSLYQPMKFNRERRVDLHPRVFKENLYYIDSGHTGKRRLYTVIQNEKFS